MTFCLIGDGQEGWQHSFEASYVVAVADNGDLTTTLNVKNVGKESFTFTVALHTYFAVSGIESAVVAGLKGCKRTLSKNASGLREALYSC